MSFSGLTRESITQIIGSSPMMTGRRNIMKNINIILSGITAVLGLLVGIAPYTFAKVCGMASMHCHKVTAPTVLVFGIVIFVISAAQTILLWKKR